MDPITHGLVGGLIAQTTGGPRKRFWILAFLSEAPDFDVLLAPLGPWAFWLQHRGISHSLLGFVLQALFYAWVFKKWDPGAYWQRAALYFLPFLFHGFCDYLTSYGVPLLSPFSFREFSADVVPAVTIIPIIFMIAGLVPLLRAHRQGWRATRPVWAAWAVYILFSFGNRAYATHLMKPYSNGDQMTVVSGLANPFGWTAVEQRAQCCRYIAMRVNTLTRTVKPGLTLEAGTDEMPILTSLGSDLVHQFITTNRWPVARATPTANGWDVDWGKVLFSSRGVVRGQVLVKVGLDGKLIKAEHEFVFWSPVENKVPVGPVETKQ
jgi:membrane-bound metal-dependent hydrolase YbcI (DUF457 family)